MGTVWRATDTQLNRLVAVKEVVTPPGIAPEDRDAMYERMLREARAAAVLSHPGVVQVYDVVTDGDRPWIVMELLDARSLSDMVLEDGPLAPRAVAKSGEIGRASCRGGVWVAGGGRRRQQPTASRGRLHAPCITS